MEQNEIISLREEAKHLRRQKEETEEINNKRIYKTKL